MDDGYAEEESDAGSSSSSPASDFSSFSNGSNYSSYSSSRSGYTPRTGRVVNIQTSAQLQVMLVQPDRFEDCKPIADELNKKITVVLNLEGRAPDLSRRVLDFLSGVTYANPATSSRLPKTPICSPPPTSTCGGT